MQTHSARATPAKLTPSTDEADEVIGEWRPFDEVYAGFCERQPQLGYKPDRYSASRLRSLYGAELLREDIAVRLPSGRWLARRAGFDITVFRLIMERARAIVQSAQAREEQPKGDA